MVSACDLVDSNVMCQDLPQAIKASTTTRSSPDWSAALAGVGHSEVLESSQKIISTKTSTKAKLLTPLPLIQLKGGR